jgi:hypothetical protein
LLIIAHFFPESLKAMVDFVGHLHIAVAWKVLACLYLQLQSPVMSAYRKMPSGIFDALFVIVSWYFNFKARAIQLLTCFNTRHEKK